MSVARFIADQRIFYRVPHAFTWLLLGISESWFYKWINRTPTLREQRLAEVDAAVRAAFDASRRLHGSPRCTPTWSRPAGRSPRRPSQTRCAARAWWLGSSSAEED